MNSSMNHPAASGRGIYQNYKISLRPKGLGTEFTSSVVAKTTQLSL